VVCSADTTRAGARRQTTDALRCRWGLNATKSTAGSGRQWQAVLFVLPCQGRRRRDGGLRLHPRIKGEIQAVLAGGILQGEFMVLTERVCLWRAPNLRKRGSGKRKAAELF